MQLTMSICPFSIQPVGNLPTDCTFKVVTMHTLLYGSHVEYENKNTSMSTKVNNTAP